MGKQFVGVISTRWVSRTQLDPGFQLFNWILFAGILIYTIHSSNKKPVKQFNSNLDSFKSFAADLKLGKYPSLNCVPNGIVDSVRLMIHYNPDMRPSLYELPKVCHRLSFNHFD